MDSAIIRGHRMSQIEFLIDKLNFYRDAYYNRNLSLISDAEYDKLYDRLKELEDKSGVLYANSPTQTVGYTVVSALKKVKHDHPLLSLGKTTDLTEFIRYFGKRKFVIMQKLDGLTVTLRYVDGKFVSGATRGNGEIGEDITHNVRTFVNIPLEIPVKGEFVVDGEAIIDRKTFDDINNKLVKSGQKPFKNQRNLASGTVRQLDSKLCAERRVRFIAWNLASCDTELNSHWDRLMYLNEIGFEICDNIAITNTALDRETAKAIENYVNLLKINSDNKGMPIDGLVGRFDDIQYGKQLGMTGHHPKHSLAFKFYQERNETVFRRIEWSTSRTNLINPVAVFDPVEIDGTTVNRATLNNISQIKKLELGYDDDILVIKANQIIPQITENLTRSGTVEIPKYCPDCGAETYIKQDGIAEFLYCSNKDCSGAAIDRLVNFCGKEGMNIRGLSEERLKVFFSGGFINRNFTSIYELNLYVGKLKKIEGFGDSSIDSILKAIEESRQRPLANVLVAIGIPSIGKSTAKVIARKCGNSPTKFLSLACTKYNWSALPDIGKQTADKINDYVASNYDDFKNFFSLLNGSSEIEESTKNIFGGATFCITGKLVSYKNRDELVKDIERFGGKVVSGVTSKTKYLITNNKEEQTSKTKNAKKYRTEIISEEDFKRMVEDGK